MCKGLEPGPTPSSQQQSTREAGKGGGGQKAPPRSLSQTSLRLTLTSSPQCRQGQKRKLRPREVTESEAEPPSKATCSGKPVSNLTFHGQGLHILPRAGSWRCE